jgi:hypothetical protein
LGDAVVNPWSGKGISLSGVPSALIVIRWLRNLRDSSGRNPLTAAYTVPSFPTAGELKMRNGVVTRHFSVPSGRRAMMSPSRLPTWIAPSGPMTGEL